jgi:hypothetical protein
MPCGIEVEAHDPAAVVDAGGGGSGVRVIDRGEDAVVQQRTVLCSLFEAPSLGR